MKGYKPFPFLVLSLYLCAMLTACASGTPQNPPGALNIANPSVPDGVVLSPYSVTLVPTGGLAPFTWTLDSGTLPPGLTLSSGGVISGTPPVSDLGSGGIAKKYSFTVRVTDSQTPTAAYQKGGFSITINPLPVVTSTTLPDAFIGVFYTTTLTNSGGLAPFTWTITAGTLPAGLTLSASAGIISGTSTAGTAGTYPLTIQVTDADSNSASANVNLTVKGKLQGSFAFSFNGFNNGQPFYTVGSFVGDGAGNLTGILDQNDTVNGPVTATPVTGTYSIGTNNLGTLSLTIPALNNVTYNYILAVPLSGDLRFTLADANYPQVYGSGVIKAQNLTSLISVASLAENWALGYFGVDPAGSRSAGAGSFKSTSSGSLTGIEDTNDNGTVQSQVALTGAFDTSVDLTTGRGTATFNVGTSTLHYAFYVVNPKIEMVALQTDAYSSGASLSLVSLLVQLPGSVNGSFSNGTLNATSVMELNGVSTSTGTAVPDVSLGVNTCDGQGNITLFQTDENNGGTATRNTLTGTYNVDPNTGRVAVAGLGSTPPVWYLVNANRGFAIGTDPSVTEGIFEPQVGGPFSLASFLLSYAGTTVQPVLPSVTNEADSTTIPAPGGTLVVTYDTSGPGAGEPMMNLTVKLPYVLDPNNGTATGAFFLGPPMSDPTPTNYCQCDEIVYMVTAAAAVTGGSPDFSNNKWVSINLAVPATGTADPNPRITSVASTHK